MGAWGHLPFDNDTTNDWAYYLKEVEDLSLVDAAFDDLEEIRDEYLDQDIASNAIGACEVLARLLGHPGYQNSYTRKVDSWVAAHKVTPSPEQLKRAKAALDRILGENSELHDLWKESDIDAWRKSLEDLRERLNP